MNEISKLVQRMFIWKLNRATNLFQVKLPKMMVHYQLNIMNDVEVTLCIS